MTTADELVRVMKLATQRGASGSSIWMVNPTVYKRTKNVWKRLERLRRKTALRRSVHRAYRKAGLPLPMVSR